MCLVAALLQMSWPKPAWFGSPAPAAAKSGNEVNERVVLGRFPLISTQLKSNSGSDLRHLTFQCSPGLLGFQGTRQEMAELGAFSRQEKCSGGAWDPRVGQLKQLHSSTRQSSEKQKGTPAGPGWPAACGGSRPCWEQKSKTC